MAGRKAIYNPETMEIGDRVELRGSKKAFRHQYVYNWEKRVNKNRIDNWGFKPVVEGNKVFIERVF